MNFAVNNAVPSNAQVVGSGTEATRSVRKPSPSEFEASTGPRPCGYGNGLKGELPNPVPIRRFGAHGKMLETHNLMQLLAQAQRGIGHQAVRPAECGFSRFHILPIFAVKSFWTSEKTRNKVEIMKGDIPQNRGIITS
jgi:hypothetical protein